MYNPLDQGPAGGEKRQAGLKARRPSRWSEPGKIGRAVNQGCASRHQFVTKARQEALKNALAAQ